MESYDNIRQFLISDFGLSEIEANIYLTLLRYGPSTVLEVSRYTGMNRATVHLNVENLVKTGLLSQTKSHKNKRRMLIAESPEKLGEIIEDEKRKIDKVQKKLGEVIGSIHDIMPGVRDNTTTEIKYYETDTEVLHLYKEILRSDEVRSYVNDKNEAPKFAELTDRMFVKAHRTNPKMKIWDILYKDRNINEYVNKMVDGRFFYKYFPDTLKMPQIDYMMCDNKVAVVTFVNGRVRAVLHYNKNYYEAAKAIFDFIWQVVD